MRNLFLLIIASYFSSQASAQTFAIGHTAYVFDDTTRPGRAITTEIYYPATMGGEDVSIPDGTEFPYVIMSHGFLMTFDAYAYIWETLVPAGYIVILPTTAGEFFPDHAEYAKDIAFLSNEFLHLAELPASVFYGHIQNICGAMGHSMGGGATLLAMQYPNNIRTTITFAAAETSPSAIDASAGIEAPSLIFAGSSDCVTPPASNQELMYANIPACKTLINITGASHCQFADYNFTCSLGELLCTIDLTIEAQHATINNFLLPWLQYFLYNDNLAKDTFQDRLITSNEITYLQDCLTLTEIESQGEIAGNTINIYPNPADNYFFIEAPSDALYTLMTITGVPVKNFYIPQGTQFAEISEIKSGTYILQMTNRINTITTLLIIK